MECAIPGTDRAPVNTETGATPGPARCWLCGGEDLERLSDRLRFEAPEKPGMRPYRCRDCTLVFLYPGMTAEEEAAFYEGAYRRLYHGPDYDLDRFHAARTEDALRRRDRLQAAGLLQGRLLEVGAATGRFLELAAEAGVIGVGVEPDRRQRAYARARGLRMVADLADWPAHERFDLVVLFHVLEHVREPVAFLRELAGRLKPGGRLVVEVPNVDDALLSRYRIPAFADFYWHPAHRSYFSRRTLERVARAAGFRGRVEGVQRYGLSNHLHWAIHGRPGGQGWLADLLSPETERAYAEDLCRRFICDTLWLVAERDDSLGSQMGGVP